MAVSPLSEGTPTSQFTLYDVINGKKGFIAEFQTLTGGDQKISMVTYNIITPLGGVTTRSMPGQTTFAPVVLLRPMDKACEELYKTKFRPSVDGKLKTLRRDYSVSMNDAQANPVVWWHLINAVPTVLDGFMFNMRTENNYTDFEISFQAEDILIEFA